MSLIVQVQDQAFQAMLIASIETFPTSYLPQETGKQKRLRIPAKLNSDSGPT